MYLWILINYCLFIAILCLLNVVGSVVSIQKKLNIQKFVIMQLLGSFAKWTYLMQYLCNFKIYENLNPNHTIEYNKLFILIFSTFILGSHYVKLAMIIMTFACHHIDISIIACDSHCHVMPLFGCDYAHICEVLSSNALHRLVIRH